MKIEGNLIDSIYFNVKKNKLFDNRLCYCKELILKEYLHKNKFFLIELIQEFEKIIHGYSQHIDEKIFYRNNELCNFPYISKKVLTIFYEIEEEKMKLFKEKMKFFEEKIKEISNKEKQIDFLYNKILGDVIKYFEISVLNLVAFNINCKNYKDLIETKNNCKNIDFCYNDYFSTEKCYFHQLLEKHGEFLQIFVTKEIVPILDKYIEILEKYYNGNLKNVDILIDYYLIDNYKFNESSLKRYEKLSNLCKKVYVINYKHLLKNPDNLEIFEKIKQFPNVDISENHPYKIFF